VLYVLASLVTTESLAMVQASLLLLALAVWMRGRSTRPGARWVWLLIATATAAAAITAIGRGEHASGPRGLETPSAEGAISWTPFDETTALGLAAEGRLVFVDVTADWCLTCKVNEKLILARPEVAAAFEAHSVVAMKADWTRRDDTIAAYLQQFGRSGIPFYVLYRPDGNHHVFGEVLTVGAVLEALAVAADP
jgi:thiol:disulfide interchange protein